MQPLSQNHKDLGVVYTPEILVNYICQTTIHQYIIERLIELDDPKISLKTNLQDIESLDTFTQHKICQVLSEITILDPAVGVGYFLISSFKVLENLHTALIKAKIQKRTITDIIENIVVKSLFGVDISLKTVNLCLENLNKFIISSYPMIDRKKLEKSLKQQVKQGNALIGNTFDESMISNNED
ncbi:MAG: hypothetical protein KAT16_11230, partial [Candidatus Heimdallarchaeota archaeon]|nr:hypothetical protein [Candidatus Heimdallarchaeota archaeon]